MKLPIAPYGRPEMLIFTIIVIVLAITLVQIYHPLVILPVLLFVFMLYFFRDPKRQIPEGDNIILAPADGRIIEVTEVPEDSFLKCDALKITIFLSLFSVHINRAPCSGKVSWLDYRKGKFLVASDPRASDQNECNSIGLSNHHSPELKILVRQIAGIIAQRIVCDCKLDESLQAGQKIGMIKFGSRTEIYIPKSRVADLNIQLKDKVKAGETILVNIK